MAASNSPADPVQGAQHLGDAIGKILDLRESAERLRATLTTGAAQEMGQVLQDMGLLVSELGTSWPSQVLPALQQAGMAPAAAASGPVRIEIDLTDSGPVTVPAADTTARPSAEDTAPVQVLHKVLKRLRDQLDTELLTPVGTWQQIRKKAKHDASQQGGELQSVGSDGVPVPSFSLQQPALPPGVVLDKVLKRVRHRKCMAVHTANAAGTLNCLPKDATEVRVLLTNTMCAFIGLARPGSATPVRVTVDSADRLSDGSAWATSPHYVFKRVAAIASRALAYFTRRAAVALQLGEGQADGAAGDAAGGAGGATLTPAGVVGVAGTPAPGGGVSAMTPIAATPESPTDAAAAGAWGAPPRDLPAPQTSIPPEAVALEDMLLWLSSYRDLFTRSCSASGLLLALEAPSHLPLPPVFRPFKLPREELLKLADDATCIRAYHPFAAPLDMLGWEQEA